MSRVDDKQGSQATAVRQDKWLPVERAYGKHNPFLCSLDPGGPFVYYSGVEYIFAVVRDAQGALHHNVAIERPWVWTELSEEMQARAIELRDELAVVLMSTIVPESDENRARYNQYARAFSGSSVDPDLINLRDGLDDWYLQEFDEKWLAEKAKLGHCSIACVLNDGVAIWEDVSVVAAGEFTFKDDSCQIIDKSGRYYQSLELSKRFFTEFKRILEKISGIQAKISWIKDQDPSVVWDKLVKKHFEGKAFAALVLDEKIDLIKLFILKSVRNGGLGKHAEDGKYATFFAWIKAEFFRRDSDDVTTSDLSAIKGTVEKYLKEIMREELETAKYKGLMEVVGRYFRHIEKQSMIPYSVVEGRSTFSANIRRSASCPVLSVTLGGARF